MEFYETVQVRQSIRRYKSDSIPGDVLVRILEAFRAAPSWANVQPWELLLVSDLKVKKKLQSTLPPVNPAVKAILEAPVVICVLGIWGLSGWYKGQTVTGRGDWLLFDLGIATEHLVLAAASERIGSVHVGLFDYEQAGKILKIPEDRTVVELIPLGYPAHEPKRINRKDLNAFVYQESYGNNASWS